MKNLEIATIFYEIADFLEMQDVEFKPQAYRRAARAIESLAMDIEEVYQEDKLADIPGVGKSIEEKIIEFIETGRVKSHQELKKKMPVKMDEMTAIEGLGPKMVQALYKKLGIKNLKQLEKAAKAKKIRQLEGFGQKTEENILRGIQFVKVSKGRFLLGLILPIVYEIEERLKGLKQVKQISVAGSVRRMKETIGDIDFLITSSNPKPVMDWFCSMPGIVKVWGKGPTKSSIRLKAGFDLDIRVVKPESWGSALQYFTGSKEHNIATRQIAMDKGLKLNEYGVFRGEKRIAGRSEKEVYEAIGLRYIEPEIRQNEGEIEAALKNKLPKLIGYNEIKGDLHIHTTWSDGRASIRQMAEAGKEMGYQYIAITDHTGSLKIAGGLDEKKLLRQMKEIDKLNKVVKGIKILKGTEVNIKKDGFLDIRDEVLAKLDVVVAAIHSDFKMDREIMTERMIRAIENPNVDIIAHPTGRVIQRREGYRFDKRKVFAVAKKTETYLEVNAYPDRLDLADEDIRWAIKKGVKLVIASDAHNPAHLKFMELGIAQARRGWAEKKDILNTKTTL